MAEAYLFYFACPDCLELFPSTLVYGHIVSVHKRVPLTGECPPPPPLSDDIEILEKATEVAHDASSLACPDCDKLLPSTLVYGHILSVHRRVPRPNECPPPPTRSDDDVVIVEDTVLSDIVDNFVREERQNLIVRQIQAVVARQLIKYHFNK